MPSEEHRRVIEALEPRICLSTLTYGFLGSTSSSPQPPWYSTGNAGDRHTMEAGVTATPPISGYPNGHASGQSTSFTVSGIPEHTELELLIQPKGKQVYPVGGGGPGEEDPPPTGVWRFDLEFSSSSTSYTRWWNTDGSGWGGDDLHFVDHGDTLTVEVTGTWLSGGPDPGWYLDQATVWRYTPTVFMYEVDTATEGATYTTGNEPGFVIWRTGDTRLAPLVVNLSDALGTAEPGSDYESLPETVTIPADQSQMRLVLSPTDDSEREWTEDVITQLEDGDYYELGTLSPVKVHIRDNDPVDIEADGLPEEWEDEEYNETDPGLYLDINHDDDESKRESVTLRFPDEEKIVATQSAQVVLELSSPRFQVWHQGQVLLGGPEGPLSVIIDHVDDGPEMTVYVEALPPPPPNPGEPVSEGPWIPVIGMLTLRGEDVGPRATGSIDCLRLVGVSRPRLSSLTFSAQDAGGFHSVYRDKPGDDFGTEFAGPHWVDADLDGKPDVPPFPVAYRRHSMMRVTGEFKWEFGDDVGNNLIIRGDGPGDYDFEVVLGQNQANHRLTLDGETLTFIDTAAAPFDETIEHFDTFDIKWSATIDGGAHWEPIVTTKNQVYTLLDDPDGLPKLFHTLAHVSSKAAAGEGTETGLVTKVWGVFEGAQGVKRMDGTTMRYYASWRAIHTTTAGILSSTTGEVEVAPGNTEMVLAGDGTCEAWVALFLDMLGAHGKRDQGNHLTLEPWGHNHENPHYPFRDDGGFIIKNWTFVPEEQATGETWYEYKNLFLKTGTIWKNDLILKENPTDYNWSHQEVSDDGGEGGQGTGDPASLFAFHVLAKVGDHYYDVAMGKDYESVAEWRDDAIAGYWKEMSGTSTELVNGVTHWKIVFRRNTGGNHINEIPQDYADGTLGGP